MLCFKLYIASTSTEEDQDTDDDDAGTVADLQGIFNVLAQVEGEKAIVKQQDDKDVAMVQFWKRLRIALWKAYL